jgi:histidine ammonia-lyase
VPSNFAPVVLGVAPVTLAQLSAIVRGAPLHFDEQVPARLQGSVALLERLLANGNPVYGVTTGFGASVDTEVEPARRVDLARNLVQFHGCGTGQLFDEVETRAILVARICSLLRGYSAVRPDVLHTLQRLLNTGVLPAIPCQGSVGASGDLTPLSYVAAVVMGEREVWLRGRVVPTAQAFAEVGLRAVPLWPKESLALMNGTSVMTGLAALATERALRACRWAARLTAVACEAVDGQPSHFEPRLFELKPHPGSAAFAAWVFGDLGAPSPKPEPLQDRYSLRCAPHVVGVALDEIRWHRPMLETELGSVNDNPILDPESGRALHGGHFYGGHICQWMDTLKACLANLADLLDRQLVLLCDPASNRGLPANLVGAEQRSAHHGFKAVQITASALVAEACKLAMPASVFSRSTENHNQDKVSLGTIAARDCLRMLDMCEQVLAIHTLATAQALGLRGAARGPGVRALVTSLRAHVAPHTGDRRMDRDIERVLALARTGELEIGDAPPVGEFGAA